MSLFSKIDPKLKTTAKQLQARLKKHRNWILFSEFKQKRIFCEQNGLYKAIIIRPALEDSRIKYSLWNFWPYRFFFFAKDKDDMHLGINKLTKGYDCIGKLYI